MDRQRSDEPTLPFFPLALWAAMARSAASPSLRATTSTRSSHAYARRHPVRAPCLRHRAPALHVHRMLAPRQCSLLPEPFRMTANRAQIAPLCSGLPSRLACLLAPYSSSEKPLVLH